MPVSTPTPPVDPHEESAGEQRASASPAPEADVDGAAPANPAANPAADPPAAGTPAPTTSVAQTDKAKARRKVKRWDKDVANWLFPPKSRLKRVSTLAAAGLVAWAGYMLLWGKVPQVCRDEVSSSDTATKPAELVVRVCEPMAATDPRVFLFLLVVLLLLLPWFSEVEVAGLFRVKKQLEEAEKEVDGLRESVRTAQSQVTTLAATVATTSSSNSQAKVEWHVHEHRGEDSGRTQQAVLSGSDELPFTEGAFAQTAFKAGLIGLRALFPSTHAPYAMLFYTWGDNDTYEQSQAVGDVAPNLKAHAVDVVNRNPAGTYVSVRPGHFLVAQPARDDDGSVVGALVAAFASEELLADVDGMQDLLADVENVADAYARLLIDLLGETGRVLPSTTVVEEGQ